MGQVNSSESANVRQVLDLTCVMRVLGNVMFSFRRKDRMNDGVSGLAFLTNREMTQLQLSLKSRSIREVALTVCTIRSLAKEVKSILQDLCNDEVCYVTVTHNS